MNVVLVTPPAVEPVSLDEVKLHCDIVRTDQDAILAMYVAAARRAAELYQRRALITSTWDATFDVCDVRLGIRLPKAPLQSVVFVTYRDQSGNVQTLDPSNYQVVTGTPGGVFRVGVGWPSLSAGPGALTIRFVAGYPSPADVPQSTKLAILLLVGHWYEHREAASEVQGVDEMPLGVRFLLDDDRSGAYR